MKKVFKVLLVILVAFIITGCGKKEFDEDLPTGDFVSICEKTDKSDGIKVSTITTTNYNKDKYAINMKVRAVYQYETKESYDFYLEETKNTFETYKKMKHTVFKYEVNEEQRMIKTILLYKTIELNDTNKEIYTQDTIVKSSLAENATCKSIDMNKKRLLEKEGKK